MGKKRKTFSIDEDVFEEFNERDLNASAVVNRFLREYLVGGDTASVAKKLQLQDVEREIERTQNEIERLQSKLDRLRRRRETVEREIEEDREQTREIVEEYRDRFGMTNPDNPAVQNWASKAEMDPREFVEAVENGV